MFCNGQLSFIRDFAGEEHSQVQRIVRELVSQDGFAAKYPAGLKRQSFYPLPLDLSQLHFASYSKDSCDDEQSIPG